MAFIPRAKWLMCLDGPRYVTPASGKRIGQVLLQARKTEHIISRLAHPHRVEFQIYARLTLLFV